MIKISSFVSQLIVFTCVVAALSVGSTQAYADGPFPSGTTTALLDVDPSAPFQIGWVLINITCTPNDGFTAMAGLWIPGNPVVGWAPVTGVVPTQGLWEFTHPGVPEHPIFIFGNSWVQSFEPGVFAQGAVLSF